MALVAESVSKSFGGQRVLSSARLSANHGEIVGMLGRMDRANRLFSRFALGS